MLPKYPTKNSQDQVPDFEDPKRALLVTVGCNILFIPFNVKALLLLHGCSVDIYYIPDDVIRRLCDTAQNSEIITGSITLFVSIVLATLAGYKAGDFERKIEAVFVLAALSLATIGLTAFPLMFFA